MKAQSSTSQPDPEGTLRGEGCCHQCFVLKTGVTWQCVRICERKKEEKRERHVVNKLVWERTVLELCLEGILFWFFCGK